MSKNDKLLALIKISIIVMVSVFLIGFFFPFYEYPNDSKVYGYQSMWMADGKYDYTNDILETTGKWEFVPAALIKTHYNSSIPNILPLFPALGSFMYNLFGISGLFFLNPILSIIFLIIAERMGTKYFGKYVGLLTLVFLATNEMVFWVGRALLTSTLFSILFLLGTYFLMNFLKEKKILNLLIASTFFTITSFVRPNGVIFVPIEIVIVISFFVITSLYKKKSENSNSFYNFNINLTKLKKIGKISVVTIGPWIIFVLFMVGFNYHFFGDPTTTIYNVPGAPQHFISDSDNALSLNVERIEKYSGHFLPYPLNRVNDALNSDIVVPDEPIFANLMKVFLTEDNVLLSHLGIASFVVLGLSLLVSFRKKSDFLTCIVFCILIISLIIFYSINFIVEGRQGSARDMLPVFPIFYMLLGYLIVFFLSYKMKNIMRKKSKTILKSSKIFVFGILILFIPISFYFADYSQIIKKEGFVLKDPHAYALNFPQITDPIDNDDVVMTIFKWDQVIRHGSIPFTPLGVEREINPENPLYIKTINELRDIITEGKTVYIFKDPGLPVEKKFHQDLPRNGFVLNNFSENFCEVKLQTEIMKESDVVCLQNYKK